MASTRRRKELTISEKLEISDSLKSKKCTVKDIINQYNCNAATVTRILKNEDVLRKSVNRKNRRIRKGHNALIDKTVTKWYHSMREQNVFLNGPIVRRQAVKIAEKLNITNFTASNGWLWRWQKKENVVFKDLRQQRNIAEAMKVAEGNGEIDLSSALAGVPLALMEGNEEWNGENSSTWWPEVSSSTKKPQAAVIENNEADIHDVEEKYTPPNKSEAIKALDTLLEYLYENDINLKNLDEIQSHLAGSSLANTIADIHPNDVEESSVEHNERQYDTTDLEQSETSIEPSVQDRTSKIDKPEVSRDQYAVYGEHIAHRLRSCNRGSYEIYTAQHNIDDVLFNLSMGTYVRNDKQQIKQNNEQQLQDDLSPSDNFVMPIVTPKQELDL